MSMRFVFAGSAAALALLAAGCGDGDVMGPLGPAGMNGFAGSASFMSVSPRGGSVGVAPTTSIALHFGAGMGYGMEGYVDLHRGGLDGPTVPMTCGWSGDRATLTCTPHEPLQSRTTYWLHLGGGMVTSAGEHVGFAGYGPMYGGQWISGPMMGGYHAGQPWGAMGPGWHHDDDYGMAFSFTTA